MISGLAVWLAALAVLPMPESVAIVYPPENAVLPHVIESFIFGSARGRVASVSVNGAPARLQAHESGWLVMATLAPETNTIAVRVKTDKGEWTQTKSFYVTPAPPALPTKEPFIDAKSLAPYANIETQEGERLQVKMRATPNALATFQIPGQGWYPMRETWPGSGIYKGSCELRKRNFFDRPSIVYRIRVGKKTLKVASPHTLTVHPKGLPQVAVIKREGAVVMAGPDLKNEQAGYSMTLMQGVRVPFTARIGNSVRIRPSREYAGWVSGQYLQVLPPHEEIEPLTVGAWTVERETAATIVRCDLESPLAHRAELSRRRDRLTLTLYGGVSNTDWIHYADDDSWVDAIQWEQPDEDVYRLKVDLKRPVWGYDVHYDTGASRLILELRDPPRRPARNGRQLEGVCVAIDPGHPGGGAISPHNINEPVFTLMWANVLKQVLQKKGARVVMTRETADTVELTDRPLIAQRGGADIFVSLHANALPDGADPFEHNGYSVYYYQPFSHPLASAVIDQYKKRIKIRNDGRHYGNLSVVRQTAMPSVLIEAGHLIWPPEEALLMSPSFQSSSSEAIATALAQFIREYHR